MHKRNRGLVTRFGALICVAFVLLIAIILMLSLSPQRRGEGAHSAESAPTAAADTPQAEGEAEAAEALAPVLGEAAQSVGEPEPELEPEPPPRRGYSAEIPEDVRESMAGISMPDGAKVSYDDLAYLTVYFNDFNGDHAAGHMVVAKELAEEVLDIFAELYDIGYPIERMELIDEYYYKQTDELDSLDRASMGSNNTSAFCYRAMNSAGTLSQHAFGRAIDLNPKINPYVSGGLVSPANAKIYADRNGEGLPETEQRALIRKDGEVYNIFMSHGWLWGCEIWSGVYDYQHFQKFA